jgi:glycosyltransferase involved in cell wall biosynthesis
MFKEHELGPRDALIGSAPGTARAETKGVAASASIGKTLLISWTVPPGITGSAVIVGNLATQFGPDEMIVAGEMPASVPADPWHESWPRIAYIAHPLPNTWRGARWWRRLQLPLMLARAIRLAIRNRCSSVIAVFPKEEFLLIGYLTALLTRNPLILYFHNCYLENRKGLASLFAVWLQSKVFAAADHVFVMSEGMVELYRERYPDLSCSALVHPLKAAIPNFTAPPKPGSPINIIISGNINESCRDAAVRVAQAVTRIDDASLTLLSGTSHSYLRSLGLLRDDIAVDTVSPDEVVDRLRTADIVVLPHGFSGALAEEEYQTIFPTRTLDYLICGRPILAHAPADSYLATFMKSHDCALVVDEPSAAAVVAAIERLRTDAVMRARLVSNALQTAELFRGTTVAGTLRAQLESLNKS